MIANPDVQGRMTGVWIGEHIEVVRTRLFEIAFKRMEQAPASYETTLRSLENVGDCLKKTTIGICRFDGEANEIHYAMKHRFAADESEYSVNNSEELMKELKVEIFAILADNEEIRLTAENNSESYKGDKLIWFEKEEAVYSLVRDEEIDIDTEPVESPALFQSNVADCLKMWRMGTGMGNHYARPDKWNPYVEITTKRHAYIFSISHDMVYCRAARYDTCESGMVFAQNVRISQIEGYERQVYMAANNLIACEPPEIQPDYFDFDVCSITPESEGGKMSGIYWSVKEKSDNLIVLHGCRGDTYYWPRTKKDLIEFFAYS